MDYGHNTFNIKFLGKILHIKRRWMVERIMQHNSLSAQSTLASMKLFGMIIGIKDSSFSMAPSRFFPTSFPLARETLIRGNCWVPFWAVLEAVDFLKYCMKRKSSKSTKRERQMYQTWWNLVHSQLCKQWTSLILVYQISLEMIRF